MVQTVKSIRLASGQQGVFLEKPHVLSRVFFKITAILPTTSNYMSEISFDDPTFRSFYVLNGPAKYFEAKGEGIFQGDVWVLNASDQNLQYTATEILI